MSTRRAVAALFLALLAPALLPAQAVEEVDRAVAEVGRFVLRRVPDRDGVRVAVLPFLSDRDGRVLLGDRLRGELELYLAAALGRARTAASVEGENTYTVSGELQAYPTVVRLLCRVYAPDGSLVAGTRVDLRASPELSAMLVSPPAEIHPPLPGPSGPPPPGPPSAGPTAGAASVPDAFEPDDQPGFEVEVPPEGTNGTPYRRHLAPGDIDRFRFYSSGLGPVVLEARAAVDLQMLLYREGQNLPFEVAGARSGDTLRLERMLSEGYYIVELLAFDVNIQGPYSLALALGGPAGAGGTDDGFEPDDAPEQAAPLSGDTRQQRFLLPGDADWVELVGSGPGFYVLQTTGERVDTRITAFTDGSRELLADENSGEGANAFVALFLGVRRIFARIDAADPEQGGPYGLSFARVEPRTVYAEAGPQTLQVGAVPEVLQLRVFQSGRYLLAASGGPSGAGALLGVFSLPAMRAVRPGDPGGLHNLSAGDYLLLVTAAEPGLLRLCLAPESQAAACRARLAE